MSSNVFGMILDIVIIAILVYALLKSYKGLNNNKIPFVVLVIISIILIVPLFKGITVNAE